MNATVRRHRLASLLVSGALLASCANGDRLTAYREATPPPVPGKIVRDMPATPARFPVLGADTGTLERLFGPPSLRRRDPPAEYWRYDFPRCTLDLFLFRAAGDPAPRIVYFELREQAPGAAMQGCREIEARFEAPARPLPADRRTDGTY